MTAVDRPGIVCWGATGQARVLRELFACSGAEIVVVVDNRDLPSPFDGVPIVKGADGLRRWLEGRKRGDLRCVAAVGGGRGRERLQLLDEMGALELRSISAIHPRAFVAADAVLGDACQVMPMAVICAMARLGRGVIVNTAASVDHDCVLGDGVHVAPGARLCGEVVVGRGAFIGAGAIVLPRLKIGDDAVVGAGAVVTLDVEPGRTVLGNPARPRAMA